MQNNGASMRMNPDGRSYAYTATFGPPVHSFPVVTGAPYSAEEIGSKTRTLADGTRVTVAMPSAFLYRDSAGRTRAERPVLAMAADRKLSAQIPVVAEIHDPVAGCQYFLDAANRVAHRYMVLRANAAAGGGIKQPQAPALTTEPLGTQSIDGILAEGRRTTITHPAGLTGNDQPIVTVMETWNSLDLKVAVLAKTSDPRSGESTRALINIDRADPDPSLFLVPPDYAIVDETGALVITLPGPRF
jgi:hypothetical protein